MKPIRYNQEMVDEFLKDGYWTRELFYDFWERNAREYGDQEALVVLDFTVNSDGSIGNIAVVGGFHEPRFVEAATEAAN